MEVAVCIIVALLTAILAVIIGKSFKGISGHVSIVDDESSENVRVDNGRLLTHGDYTNAATQMSQKGRLISFSTGLFGLEGGFDGPVLFFRNDNPDGMDFYVDYIVYSWHPHIDELPLAHISMIYDCTEPNEFIMVPAAIGLNQKFKDSAQKNGAFVLAWAGDNPNGMIGSTGGYGVMIFTVQPVFRMINFDGRLIIGKDGTWRFDFKTESPGAIRLSVAGWFSHEI